MVSIQKLADRLGVSTATVSRALTPEHAHKVRPETRERILQLCNAANYRPSITGRSFVTGKTYKIGIILGAIEKDLGSPLFGLFMRAFCRTAQHHGYSATLLSADTEGNSQNSAIEFLQSSVADAYLLGAALLNTELEDIVRKSHCPVVTLNQNREMLAGLHSIYRDLPISLFAVTSAVDKSAKALPDGDFSIKTLGSIVPLSALSNASLISPIAIGAIMRLSYIRKELM